MRTRKPFALLPLFAATLLLTGCFHKVMHSPDPSQYGEGVPVGYVSLSFQWERQEDAETPVHALGYVFGGQAVSFTRNFPNLSAAGERLVQLPEGEYDFLATVNMAEGDGYILSGLPATRAQGDAPQGVAVSLANPASNPEQAWYGVVHFAIKANEVTKATVTLQRLASTLELTVTKLSSNVRKVDYMVRGVATQVFPAQQDASGRFGVPGSSCVDDAVFFEGGTPFGSESERRSVNSVKLFPTMAQGACVIVLKVTLDNDVELESEDHSVELPCMLVGETHKVELDYSTRKWKMIIESSTISSWEGEWDIQGGDITNPD